MIYISTHSQSHAYLLVQTQIYRLTHTEAPRSTQENIIKGRKKYQKLKYDQIKTHIDTQFQSRQQNETQLNSEINSQTHTYTGTIECK